MGEARVEIVDSSDPDLIGTAWSTDDDGNHYTVEGLTFARLRAINARRCARWHPGFPSHEDGWTGSDWSNAMGGECGEAQNVVKKLRRIDMGMQGNVDPEQEELIKQLGDEIADTVIYADLLAEYYGINLQEAIVRKFNFISEREEFPERLP